jgi:nitrate reductase gamma subunit
VKTAACAVALIAACGWYGPVCGLGWLLGVCLPYAAALIGILGLARRLLCWIFTPVPFAIPVSGGQIDASPFDAPTSRAGAAGRVALEALGFRSLLRDTRATMPDTPLPRLAIAPSARLWLAGLILHYSLLVVLLRHLRLCLEPAPAWVAWLARADAWLQAGTPAVCLSGPMLILALLFLLARRRLPRLRLMSLPADFFPLFLLLALAVSGLLMRHACRVDLTRLKLHVLGLLRFTPGATDPGALEAIAFVHLTLACALFIALPFSKLTHAGAVFLSPTRNLRCDTRAFRHANPRQESPDNGVFRSYAQYEAVFAPQLRAAGLPLDHDPPDAAGKGGCA